MASQEGHFRVVQWLCDSGADPLDTCDYGHNAPMHALLRGSSGPQPHVAVYLTSLLMAEATGEEDGEGDGNGE